MSKFRAIVIDDYEYHLDEIEDCLASISRIDPGIDVERLGSADSYQAGKQLILDNYETIDIAILDFNLDESGTLTAFGLLKEILGEKGAKWSDLPFKVLLISADDTPLVWWKNHPEANQVLCGTMYKWPEDIPGELLRFFTNLPQRIPTYLTRGSSFLSPSQ